jgi:hypothetical protein
MSRSVESLTPADVVTHYMSQPPLRSREQTRKLVASIRRLRLDDDIRRTAHSM